MSQINDLLLYVAEHWKVGESFTRDDLRREFDVTFAEANPTPTPWKTIDTLLVRAIERGYLERPEKSTFVVLRHADESQDGIDEHGYWLVGASYGGSRDQTERFLRDGIWEHGFEDKHFDQVRAMQVGDRIAIKSTFVRKHRLPFDGRGHSVSAMKIKARGTVTANEGDGRRVEVEWEQLEPAREWYFYTNRGAIWRVEPDAWRPKALVDFVFEDAPQDYDRFRNAPWWRDRFGDEELVDHRFGWTEFYEAFASGLLEWRDRRDDLAEMVTSTAASSGAANHLTDQFPDGTSGPMRDICPFTTSAIFNRGTTPINRTNIAQGFANGMGLDVAAPIAFDGIPVLNNMNSWFFGYAKDRGEDDIEKLWELYAAALQFADNGADEDVDRFRAAFDQAQALHGIGWKLTFGLYWARPWSFPPLDGNTRKFIASDLGVSIGRNGPKRRVSADDYLELMDALVSAFQDEDASVRSVPELSHAAWLAADSPAAPTLDEDDDEMSLDDRAEVLPYGLDDIEAEGCFIPRHDLSEMLVRLRQKKNVVLQGPPGTGKTWLARRLAFALAGVRDDALVTAVQFHPNLSYEDFVRGYRPGVDSRLDLVDGAFLRAIESAKRRPGDAHVVVIEEINRGNPAQVFGELLTLLEADKRSPSDALELSYRRHDGERVHIPDNLHVIGTMNVADRSLALVDLALRRRFAFIDLAPRFNDQWHEWVTAQCGISAGVAASLRGRIVSLNDQITNDPALGPHFQVGHSYLTPPGGKLEIDPLDWFEQVVETEIGPLLDEYWFDDAAKARSAREQLVFNLR